MVVPSASVVTSAPGICYRATADQVSIWDPGKLRTGWSLASSPQEGRSKHSAQWKYFIQGASQQPVHLFPFCLRGRAREWTARCEPGSLST